MVLRGRGVKTIVARNPHKRGDRTQREHMFPDWARWITTHRHFLVQSIQEEVIPGEGPDVYFYVPYTHNGVKFSIKLTSLTVPELDALQGLLESCIAIARPIVAHRDGKARENAANGDDSDPRLYRHLPTIVERPWAVGLDGESLLDRPTGFLPANGSLIITDFRSRDYGRPLVELDAEKDGGEQPASSVGQDDEPETNESS